MPLEVLNPATGEKLESFEEISPEKVRAAIETADAAFQSWRRVPFEQRAIPMRKAAAVLRARAEDLAQMAAVEMGKPVVQGRSEVEKCAWVCEYYAERAESFLEDEPVASDAARSFVAYEPLGVVLAVMPWNFPFWQVFRFAAPALMAGNAGVLKHASNVPGCGQAIEEIFLEAGFPKGLFKNLMIGSSKVEAAIQHPLVRAVTLTGSTPAGRAVASSAGRALKKTVLELGGSDPYLVLEDADLEKAAAACSASRLINGGQSCVAAKRFIVVEPVKERFEKLLVRNMGASVMGSPLEEETTLGPQARVDLRNELHDQVVRSLAQGARLLLGGTLPEGPGAFYPATVVTDVKKGMSLYAEETFGPVAAVIGVTGTEEAIEVANDSVFGLGAAVFTADPGKGEEIAARRLEAGCCFVNSYVKSDPRLPFGGIKESGYGRELSSFGIREFVNIKTVYIAA
ncbi:MAG: NAD-dependent succinate-semialdehyde dehydrogenase [Candidatus Omnitrophica bacterium]|nr:NAD-dependent succinate-semialdehyde dehydrogenase [Candidatus Omnitrophota bacterium]